MAKISSCEGGNLQQKRMKGGDASKELKLPKLQVQARSDKEMLLADQLVCHSSGKPGACILQRVAEVFQISTHRLWVS